MEYGLESFSRIIIGPILGTTKKATRFHITDGILLKGVNFSDRQFHLYKYGYQNSNENQ